MFSKKAHGDIKKSSQNVLDSRKDTAKRLKHLKLLLESFDVSEAKKFFEDNYSHIYYIFYDAFISVEAELKQRASKAHREELENVLEIFQKILILLPNLIHKRWQYHSIGRLLNKLLHPGNALKLRREGIRLFMMWYQILQENATKECHATFAGLIPNLIAEADGNVEKKKHSQEGPQVIKKRSSSTILSLFQALQSPFDEGPVSPVERSPIMPVQSGDKAPDNMTKILLDWLMSCMVSEVTKIEWENKKMQEFSFSFLFKYFKKYYLLRIFPDFCLDHSIYNPVLDLPDGRLSATQMQTSEELAVYQEVVIKWLTNFTHNFRKPESVVPQDDTLKEQPEQTEPAGDGQIPGSNTSTLSTASSYTEHDSNSSICSEEQHSINEYEIVRNHLFSSCENINLVHELFRLAFHLPLQHSSTIGRVVAVYKGWLNSDQKPIFMHEPGEAAAPEAGESTHKLEDISEDESSGSDSIIGSASMEALNTTPTANSGRLRTSSYLGAVGSSHTASDDSLDRYQQGAVTLYAGMQKTIQVFITNSANVFLKDTSSSGNSLLPPQVDLCKRVLKIMRQLVMDLYLEKKTWEQLLLVLLKITSTVLRDSPPPLREQTLGGRLAQALFQTLIVTWIKANLNVYISTDLWDHFLAVLSSLTQWEELINEWARTMGVLTRVLARLVYGLDLRNLPLDRVTTRKQIRGKARDPTGQRADRSRTFSRGWSRTDGATVLLNTTSQSAMMTKAEYELNQQQQLSQQQLLKSSQRPEGNACTNLSSFDDNEIESLEGALDALSVKSDGDRSRSKSGGPNDLIQVPSQSSIAPLLVRSSSDGNLAERINVVSSEDSSVKLATTTSSLICVNSAVTSNSSMSSGAQENQETTVNISHSSQRHHHHRHSLVEDHEVASLTSSMTNTDSTSYASVDSSLQVPYAIMDQSSESTQPLDRSQSDSEAAGTPGTASVTLDEELVHMTPDVSLSPSPVSAEMASAEDVDDTGSHQEDGKDSPTPDRESIHIDAVVSQEEEKAAETGIIDADGQEEYRSILAGGTVPGWTPDVSVVLWRRMLGSLGDVNEISDPEIHASVFEYLCELSETLLKIRDNQGVSTDNQSSPAPPEIIPPFGIFASWVFKAQTMPDKFKEGKLLAFRLLCIMTVRRHEVMLPMEHLSQFYQLLHYGLVNSDQDVINVLVKHCGPKFFSMPLPGSTMMMLDFIQAVDTIFASPEQVEAPQAEAISLLGSLLCFPNHFQEISVLEPIPDGMNLVLCSDLKDHLVEVLLKAGKQKPAGLAKCVAISSLSIFLYEELNHGTMHSKLKDAVNVLLVTLRFSDKTVAQVACDMLLLMCDHVQILLTSHNDLLHKIIEVMANSISSLLPKTNADSEKRFIVSLIFCLLEWCIRVPMSMLLDSRNGQKSLIHAVFKVLNQAATGNNSQMSKSSLTLNILSDFANQDDDEDVESSRESQSGPTTPKTPLNLPLPEMGRRSPMVPEDLDTLKLAARTAINHLVNHLGHFPKAGGASRLNSTVLEFHDSPKLPLSELSPELFEAPHVQFFVLNNNAVISFIELPALLDVPGGGVTSGLTTGNTVTRVVIRDVAGKFCWDSAILFGPPDCQSYSYIPNPNISLFEPDNDEYLSVPPLIEHIQPLPPSRRGSFMRKPNELPLYDYTRDDMDNLDDLLVYIGVTSKECQLRPGEPLNIPPPAPEDITQSVEENVVMTVLSQRVAEKEYTEIHKADNGMIARQEEPEPAQEPTSQFQMCRMLLSQLGFIAWEKRAHFDLLKKSDKLLRELKNLDNQYCRETHKVAVIYVAAGQEDKMSILNNSGGSKAYEDFVSGLGWEVDLEHHCGFRGGLQSNKSNGDTAPYYATSCSEVIFHVSTRMPQEMDDTKNKKLRHLGNDEVQIIWSEHYRDYRRGIIPTEFGDVLICIYPLETGLYRIQIDRKPEVPYFGPLFDGAIIDHKVLPGLVRATAINASCARRSQLEFYQSFYEQRAKYLEAIVSQHKELTMFEDFAENVFAPVLCPENILPGTPFSETSSFFSNNNNGLTASGEHSKNDSKGDKHSPSSKHSKGSDQVMFEFPNAPNERSLTRRLSLRTGRKGVKASQSASPPESPPKNRR
ncbi:ral GTPase-activating protein subunit alpha-1-like [Tubulanus polymorphus]|uniref:ral GTPase-activating protein subunit alpha-1-like n=1 Tax=Tubulanus polymorphus TaxID=672921 RepID=UPI003DA5E94F